MSRIWAALRSNPYGWVMVCVAALAMVATLPGRTHGLGMITERLLADPAFGLDRVTYADMNLWATLLGGLFCLPCGYLIDRYGLRITLTVTVAALGMAVVAMTRLTGWWSLFVVIVLTRGFGQSALSIISITMVGKWFTGKMSLPMAVYSLLLSFGFAYSAQLAKPFATDDWRVLWGGMGWILLLVMTPVALLLTRDPVPAFTGPDSTGSLPDREARIDQLLIASDDVGKADVGFTLAQAMRTPAFWLFGLAISVIALIGSGKSLFNESVLKQQGFPPEVFYNLITLTGMVGLAVKLPVGWLGQHWPLNRLQAVGMFLLAACLVWLPFIHSTWAITVYGIGTGISGTITTVLFFTGWGQAYGRKHLGQIQSVAQMMTVLASAAGPKVFAECFERYHSYAPAFQVLAGVVAVLGIWSLIVRVPSPEEVSQTSQVPITLTVQESSI